MSTNKREYINNYMKERYHNNLKHRENIKRQARIRQKALGLLSHKHKKEFDEIRNALMKEFKINCEANALNDKILING